MLPNLAQKFTIFGNFQAVQKLLILALLHTWFLYQNQNDHIKFNG